MKQFLKKYLPDIIIISGIFILAISVFTPSEYEEFEKFECYAGGGSNCYSYKDYGEWIILAVVLISVGVDIAIRRYISKNK